MSLYSIKVSIASLVVPAISLTIVLSEPESLLTNEDFPALGFPITANFKISSSSSGKSILPIISTTISSISPKFTLCSPDIGTRYSKPNP